MTTAQLVSGVHVTSQKRAESIKQGGFNLDYLNRGFGHVWGEGIYFALNEFTVDYYKSDLGPKCKNMFGDSEIVALKVQAQLDNPLAVDYLPHHYDQSEAISEAITGMGCATPQRIAPPPGKYNGEPTFQYILRLNKHVESLGFDGMLIYNKYGPDRQAWTGGDQALVFNPTKVRVQQA